MRRGLALGALAAAIGVSTAALALLGACASDQEATPRFLEESGFTPDARTDARADHYVPCDPTDSTCADAASDASTDAGDSGEAGLCPATNECSTARDLGRVSGDNNADQQTAMGSTSDWLKVRVSEDSTVAGASLKAKISLISPAGANFDLFVYYDPLVDVVKCTPATASSMQQAGISDAVSLVWGEGLVPNGSDDSRTVTIEVRHVSGTCAPTDKWTLIVQGNQ